MTEPHFKRVLPDSTNPTFFKDSGTSTEIAVGRNGIGEDCTDVFLGIHMHWSFADSGEAWTKLDADELRDAIDKAVGPREADKLFSDQAIIYHKVAMHPVFDEFWTVDSTPSAEAMIEKLDELFDSDSAAAKPYRPIDRDRLLRHIEDIEATLARRNERHEQDQERIRELEEIAMRRGDRIEELEAEAAALSPEEQLEARRKEYEGKGLADWEIELLMGEGA